MQDEDSDIERHQKVDLHAFMLAHTYTLAEFFFFTIKETYI